MRAAQALAPFPGYVGRTVSKASGYGEAVKTRKRAPVALELGGR
jgi:hypothetical protein